MDKNNNDILELFKKNSESVKELITFDEEVLLIAITALENANSSKKLETTIKTAVSNSLNQLKSIKETGSTGKKYKLMLNQCIVLLVSYFESALETLFRTNLIPGIKGLTPEQLENIHKDYKEIKIQIDGIRGLLLATNESQIIADVIISSKRINFQDMQSIASAFKNYYGININRDSIVNNIILSQACRHCIVHNGNVIDKQAIHQLRDANDRKIKKNLEENNPIQFEENEINTIIDNMETYIKNLIEHINHTQSTK